MRLPRTVLVDDITIMSGTASRNPLAPRTLIWGGRSMARIVSQMLVESGRGIPWLVFDDTLGEPFFESTATFVNSVATLKARLHEVTHFVACIGSEHGFARFQTSATLQTLGLTPLSVIHETAFIEPTSRLGPGSCVMPRVVVHKYSEVGDQVILNTHATIDHECTVGDGAHIMGSAAIAGRVRIAAYASIGTNATILPDLTVGEGAIVGAGAVVTRDVDPYTVVAGNPAKSLGVRRPKLAADALAFLTT